MSGVNKVMLLGNLTRDPELKEIGGGRTVCKFGLAVNREYNTRDGEKREEATFVDCVCWGRPGETLARYKKRGDPLFVEGRLKFDSWEDNGQKRSKLEVVVDNFQFVGGRSDGGGQGGGEGGDSPF